MGARDENAMHLAGTLPEDAADGCGPPVASSTAPTPIRIVTGLLHEAVDAGIAALHADPDLYQRDCELVHVSRATPEEEASTAGAVIAGTPKIHVMTSATLRVRLCKWGQWERADARSKEWVRSEPSRNIVEGIRDAKTWPGIRPLLGIIETPSFRPDGSVLEAPGYDAATGYIFAPPPAAHFLQVPQRPTRDDARAALALLADLFADFPYAVDAGSSAAVAALLTLIARPAIAGPAPAFLFDATTPGSGKSLQVDVISAIATGRDAGRQHFPFAAGRDRDSELSKVLGAIARRGAALVNFDNLDATAGRFGGSALELCLTARDTYTFRILGKSDGLTVPWRTVVFGTGNNVTWTDDMNRRILVSRLESTLENPENRPADSYKHPERAGRLLDFALERRAEYVRAALTLLRAYFVAGRPAGPTWGTFEAWSKLIAGAIVWAGGVNPMKCRPVENGEESPDTLHARILAQEWDSFCRAASQRSISAHAIIAAAYPKDRHADPSPQWEELRGAIEYFAPTRPGSPPDPSALVGALRKLKGRPCRTANGRPLRRFVPDGTLGGRARWRVEDIPTAPAVDVPTAAE